MAMSATWTRLRTAAWLGWQVDSNWTDPFLFLTYAIARPLATGLILVGMYWAVRGPGVSAALFAGFYVANAFHAFVNTVLVDMGWIVFGEREEYETLKYIVASPIGLRTYLTGRSLVKYVRATFSCTLMLVLGWFLLGVRWDWAAVRPLPLVLATACGLVSTLTVGFLVAGSSLVLTRAAMTVLEGTALALYLLCGVIFPVDLLPRALQWVAFALPFTWWYEALRRFLLGHGSGAVMNAFSDTQLLGGLVLSTVLASAFSVWGFHALERHARRLGRIDQTTLF